MADQTTQQGGDDGKKPLDNKDLKVEKPLTKEGVVYENKMGERVKKTEAKGERNELKQDIVAPINPFTPFQLKKDDTPPNLQSSENLSNGKKQESTKIEYKKDDFVKVPAKNEKQLESKGKPRPRMQQKQQKPEAKNEHKSESKPANKQENKLEQKPMTSTVPVNPFARQEQKSEQKAEIKPEQKPAIKQEQKPAAKPEQKPEHKPETKPEQKSEKPLEVKPAEFKPDLKVEQLPQKPIVPNVPINPFSRPSVPEPKPITSAVPVNPFARQEQKPEQKSEKPLEVKPVESKPDLKIEQLPQKPTVPNVPINPFSRPNVPEPKPMNSAVPVNPFARQEQKPETKSETKPETKPEQKPEVKVESVPQHVIPNETNKKEKPLEGKPAPVMSPFAKESGEAKVINPFEKTDDSKKTFVDTKTVASEKPKANPFEQDKKESVKIEVIEGGAKKNPLPHVTTVSAGKAEPVPSISKANDDFKSEFWQILEQAGITKAKLIGFAVVLVVGIFALLFFVFGWGNGGSSPVPKVEVIQDKPVENETVPVANSKAYGLISSYIFGLEYGKLLSDDKLFPIGIYGNEDGLISSLELGGMGDAQKIKFVYYTDLLRRMQNVFEVDPYGLLTESTDRMATLDRYLIDLNNVISEAMIAYSEIDQQANIWFAEYDQILKNQKNIEVEFFNYLNGLKGESAYKSLGNFMDSTQQASEIKAYANAYKSLKTMFINSLNVLRPRYSDVYYNREALVKGIKVIDVPNSNINAIIRLP